MNLSVDPVHGPWTSQWTQFMDHEPLSGPSSWTVNLSVDPVHGPWTSLGSMMNQFNRFSEPRAVAPLSTNQIRFRYYFLMFKKRQTFFPLARPLQMLEMFSNLDVRFISDDLNHEREKFFMVWLSRFYWTIVSAFWLNESDKLFACDQCIFCDITLTFSKENNVDLIFIDLLCRLNMSVSQTTFWFRLHKWKTRGIKLILWSSFCNQSTIPSRWSSIVASNYRLNYFMPIH